MPTRNWIGECDAVTASCMRNAAQQARKSLRGQAGNVPEVQGLPSLPVISTAPATLLTIYTDIASVWEQVNGLPAASVPAVTLPLRIPLTQDNALLQLDLAEFRARTEAFRSATESVRDKEATVAVHLGERNALHKQATETVKRYAALVRGLLPDGHPLLATIPTLTG